MNPLKNYLNSAILNKITKYQRIFMAALLQSTLSSFLFQAMQFKERCHEILHPLFQDLKVLSPILHFFSIDSSLLNFVFCCNIIFSICFRCKKHGKIQWPKAASVLPQSFTSQIIVERRLYSSCICNGCCIKESPASTRGSMEGKKWGMFAEGNRPFSYSKKNLDRTIFHHNL